jgi:hypothetical protein
MRNIIVTVFASIVLVIGMISMVTPIPGGTLMIAFSLTSLICTSPRARFCLKAIRTPVSLLNKAFMWLEGKVGDRIGVVGVALRMTNPLAEQEASPSESAN